MPARLLDSEIRLRGSAAASMIDWALRESGRTKMRVMVKRIYNKYGYPPDRTLRRGCEDGVQAQRIALRELRVRVARQIASLHEGGKSVG